MGTVSDDELSGRDWADIFRRLTLFAKRRLGRRATLEDAKEIAQEALRRFLDPKYAGWDKENQPEIQDHLGSIVNGIVIDRLRLLRTRLESLRDFDSSKFMPIATDELDPETRTCLRDYARKLLDAMLSRVSGDELAQQVLLLQIDGVESPAAQAAKLSEPITKIYNARRRLSEHRSAVDQQFSSEASNVRSIAE